MNNLEIIFIMYCFQIYIGVNASNDTVDTNYTKYLNDKIILGNNIANIIFSPYEQTYNILVNGNFNISKNEDLIYFTYYFIEFILIPSLIDRYRDYKYGYAKSFNESILTDESFFSEFFESMTMTNAKIKIEKKIISDSIFEIIYDFGKMDYKEPLCRYAIFYADNIAFQFEYFTLEKNNNCKKYEFCIGSVKDNQYCNFDVECAPELDVFESFVRYKINEYAIKSFEMGSKIEKSYAYYAYYDLQFKHLPNLFSIYEKRENFFKSLNNGDNFLYNITAIKITFYLSYNYSSEYINWEEFHFYKKNLASDVVEYIYDFGVPKSYFHCRYAIYYVDPINRIYEYFTLEKTKNDKIDTYIICGKKK